MVYIIYGIFFEKKVFWGALEQLHGGFSDIGAHQDFQKPDSFMPELSLKVPCPYLEKYIGRSLLVSDFTKDAGRNCVHRLGSHF